MTIREVLKPSTQSRPIWKQIRGPGPLLALIGALLILTGCTLPADGAAARSAQDAALPHPPIAPATYATFVELSDVPQRIVIETIDLDTRIEQLGWRSTISPAGRVLANWDVTAYSAGWHVNSAAPGEGGNVVLSGHNNILGAVFRELDQLEAGDVATVWSDRGRYEYEISDVFIVPEQDATAEQRRQNASWIGDFQDDRLTLVTCWPRDGNSHRIIAIGHRIPKTS